MTLWSGKLFQILTHIPGEVVVVVGVLEVVIPGIAQLAAVVIQLLVIAQLRQCLQRQVKGLPKINQLTTYSEIQAINDLIWS